MALRLRQMQLSDLPRIARWLDAPHVARWWLVGSSVERELEDIREGVTGMQAVHLLVVVVDDEPVGWCQWYLCEAHAGWAADVHAVVGDVGIDYAIGEVTRVGRGAGTELVAALVELVRTDHPDCGIIADPDERNAASRRVLEKNGFALVRIASLPSEPTDDPVAVYRLAPATGRPDRRLIPRGAAGR